MMRMAAATGAAFLLTAGAGAAAGLDRSGQPVGVLFQPGNYAELSFGFVRPEVSGTADFGGGPVSSGSMAGDYSQLSFALKMDLSDRLSFAVIVDQPYGADVSYPISAPPYLLAGTTATVSSQAITGLLRYRINDRFSVHGGLRGVAADADVRIRQLGSPDYVGQFDRAAGLGYVVGVAYEIPDIALRAALTWSSAVDFSSHTTEMIEGITSGTSTTDFTMPQQITLDFQTGIAANTLLMAQVKWVEWSATSINPDIWGTMVSPASSLVHYEHDRMSYSLGIGRKFSDSFSGAITVGYEPPTNDNVLNLSGTDGQYSLQVGGTYTMGDVSFTGGIRYVWLGDAETENLGADFRDNHAVALGLSVGYRF